MKLSRVNSLLLAFIIVVNGYTAFLPLLPALSFWWQKRSGAYSRQLKAEDMQTPTLPNAGQQSVSNPGAQPNSLIVPSALIKQQPVFEGPTARTLRMGIWHRPNSSTPDKGGNTVLSAHRFTYTNPRGNFYYLDKIRPGDEIGLIWNNAPYTYTVSQVRVVSAQDASIEAPAATSRLVLYTCTPLWLPKDRLVVVALPKEQPHE